MKLQQYAVQPVEGCQPRPLSMTVSLQEGVAYLFDRFGSMHRCAASTWYTGDVDGASHACTLSLQATWGVHT